MLCFSGCHLGAILLVSEIVEENSRSHYAQVRVQLCDSVFVDETAVWMTTFLTLLKVTPPSCCFCRSWVAYEKPGFMGHQYLLEEGEYKDWKDWGGYNGDLQSLRPILSVS